MSDPYADVPARIKKSFGHSGRGPAGETGKRNWQKGGRLKLITGAN
jgi:hypothetical protein